ncbi:MAG: hypothetical protein V4629_06085 [Pseudomonadota bacterium]
MMESVLFNPSSGRSSPAPECERRSERSISPTGSASSTLIQWVLKPLSRSAVDTIRTLSSEVVLKNQSIIGQDLREVVLDSNQRVFLHNVKAHFCYVTIPFDMTKIHCTNVDFSNAVLINAFKNKGVETLRGNELKAHLAVAHDSSKRTNTVDTALFTVNDAVAFLKNAQSNNLTNSELDTLKIRIVQSVSRTLNQGNFGISNEERNSFITEANLSVKNLSEEVIDLLGGIKDLNDLNNLPIIEN